MSTRTLLGGDARGGWRSALPSTRAPRDVSSFVAVVASSNYDVMLSESTLMSSLKH